MQTLALVQTHIPFGLFTTMTMGSRVCVILHQRAHRGKKLRHPKKFPTECDPHHITSHHNEGAFRTVCFSFSYEQNFPTPWSVYTGVSPKRRLRSLHPIYGGNYPRGPRWTKLGNLTFVPSRGTPEKGVNPWYTTEQLVSVGFSMSKGGRKPPFFITPPTHDFNNHAA